MTTSDAWIANVERQMRDFARRHSVTYRKSDRHISAAFEIGCFQSLVRFYEGREFNLNLQGLSAAGEYKYLTSPNGNPSNFSYVTLDRECEHYEMRQQVRIESHLSADIRFTPDIVVLRRDAVIRSRRDPDYASGKRGFFRVLAGDVVAAHECKSMTPFPELLVSFIGMLVAAHSWLSGIPNERALVSTDGPHLAPSLFVGGPARNLDIRMVRAMRRVYPRNAIVGMHAGSWSLDETAGGLTLIRSPFSP